MSDTRSKPDSFVKVLVVGEKGVGKSCLLHREKNDSFPKSDLETIGVEYRIKDYSNLSSAPDKTIRARLCKAVSNDPSKVSDQEHQLTLGAHLVCITYDITRKETFDKVKAHHAYWTKKQSYKAKKFVLVGNKADLKGNRKVKTTEGQELADELKMPFFETSAKDGTNVSEAFKKSIEVAYDYSLSPNRADDNKEEDSKIFRRTEHLPGTAVQKPSILRPGAGVTLSTIGLFGSYYAATHNVTSWVIFAKMCALMPVVGWAILFGIGFGISATFLGLNIYERYCSENNNSRRRV